MTMTFEENIKYLSDWTNAIPDGMSKKDVKLDKNWQIVFSRLLEGLGQCREDHTAEKYLLEYGYKKSEKGFGIRKLHTDRMDELEKKYEVIKKTIEEFVDYIKEE